MFMVLQAALAALLSRLGAGSDIVIGTPIAGRTDAALDDLVGFFVNTLVLRTDTSGNPSFIDLVGRVRAGDLAAYGHQDLPFERLVEVINPARSLSRHPLFQVMLALQNTAAASLELAGLSASLEPLSSGSVKFDLTFSLGEVVGADGSAGGIHGMVEYSADVFERGSVEALSERLVRVLEAVVARPGEPIGSIDILAARERDTILRGWNDTAHALPAATLPELFAAQAARTPDAVAVVFEDERLSYAQLDARSNQLAHHLRGLGVGPEVHRRAVRRALARDGDRAARHPQGGRRLSAARSRVSGRAAEIMMSDARPRLLLCHSALVANLPVPAGVERVLLDREDLSGQRTSAPVVDLRADHLVYTIYTSGSTGRPKGAANTHAGLHEPPAVDAGGLSADGRRCGAAEDTVQLRCLGLGVLLAAGDGSAAGAGGAGSAP